MRLLLHLSIILAASAAYLPLKPRLDACEDEIAEQEDPVDDGPTADGTAGLGIEFESPAFYFVNNDCDLDETYASRKAVIAGRQSKDEIWKLTGDTGGGQGRLNAEYILDGRQIKVGSGDAARVGKNIYADLELWQPWKAVGSARKVTVAGSKCNPWTIDAPSSRARVESLPWDPQVTLPMPLEALYSIMLEYTLLGYETKGRNILTGFPPIQIQDAFILVTKEFFQYSPNGMDMSTVTNDVLAFCSLVLSYANGATKPILKDRSPKMMLPFMPRTEFNTLYKQVQSKVKGDLFSLINALACFRTEKDGEKLVTKVNTAFCAQSKQGAPVPYQKSNAPLKKFVFSDLAYLYEKTEIIIGDNSMSVKDWINGIGKGSPSPDLLTQFDKLIDGCIGGFGSTMERLFLPGGPGRPVPIFEMRELQTLTADRFGSWAGDVDTTIQALHQQYAKPPLRKRQAGLNCTSLAAPTTTSASPAASISCTYQDGTPETPLGCTCISGTSTIVVQPFSIASVTAITQSCDYTTWPSNVPTVTAPPQTVTTDFPGCQVCTVLNPNEADCTALPSSLGCTPTSTTTITTLSAATNGVTVGTLTGTALYSAITSAIDSVCQVPSSTGPGMTGSFTCNEGATATVASNIQYSDNTGGINSWDYKGSVTLQVTEANYDSWLWYTTSKAALGAFVQNSTQGNCQQMTAVGGAYGVGRREELALRTGSSILADNTTVYGPVGNAGDPPRDTTVSICNVGSAYEFIEVEPSSNTTFRQLAFNLQFESDTSGNIFCQFIEEVVQFVEGVVATATDTEGALPAELKLDTPLEQACSGSSS